MKKSKNINIKILPEIGIGIIFLVAVSATILIWINSQSISDVIITRVFRRPAQPAAGTKHSPILFASQGNRNIYKVQNDDNKWTVLMDNGQQSQAYDSVANPTFSDDGSQFAFTGTNGDETQVVVNNNAQDQTFTDVSQIIFSPDGKSIAYVATTSQGSVIIINGKKSKTYQEIAPLSTPEGTVYAIFSPNGQAVAYKVVDSNGAYIVVNGQAGKEYSDVSNFTFSADGTQFAYSAEIGNETVTVVNNKEIVNNNDSNPAGNSPPSAPTNYSNDTGSSHVSHNLYDPGKLNFNACNKGSSCNF